MQENHVPYSSDHIPDSTFVYAVMRLRKTAHRISTFNPFNYTFKPLKLTCMRHFELAELNGLCQLNTSERRNLRKCLQKIQLDAGL